MASVVALSEQRRCTRGAALTGVSQSGMSAVSRSLADELGTSLSTHITRRFYPPEAGQALLPYARAMREQATAARDAVVQASRELSSTLRIGAGVPRRRRRGHPARTVPTPVPRGDGRASLWRDLATADFIDCHPSWHCARSTTLHPSPPLCTVASTERQ